LEEHAELVALWLDVLSHQSWVIGERHFAHSHDLRIVIEHLLSHLLEVFVDVRAVAVDTGSMLPGRGRVCYRCVGKTCGLRYHVDHIHSEAANALVEPEAHVVVYGATQLRVVPIEIWLFFGENA
jgi:hypothetical protein